MLTLVDARSGAPIPLGQLDTPGIAVTREQTPFGLTPVVAAEGDRVALFASEARTDTD